MSDVIARRQGQPVLFLGLLLAGWCLARLLLWESPWPQTLRLSETLRFAGANLPVAEPRPATRSIPLSARAPEAGARLPDVPGYLADRTAVRASYRDIAAQFADPTARQRAFDTHRRAAGHALLFSAGLAALPLPRSVATALDNAGSAPRDAFSPQIAGSAWRIASWVVLRQGDTGALVGGVRPASYGASQMGALLSYRLAPGTAHDPGAYARATKALVEDGETEAAVGLRLRPFARVPLAVHAEVRATHRPGQAAEFRPAAFVAGGFERRGLPAGLNARGYGQAGFVGGSFATPFADGALVVERDVAAFDLGDVALGATARGGAQKGAARLDVGPKVSFRLTVGQAPARIEADYLWRVAGNAAPGNGGLITLSTGF